MSSLAARVRRLEQAVQTSDRTPLAFLVRADLDHASRVAALARARAAATPGRVVYIANLRGTA